jgi:phosphatidylglycerophosphate synthase
MLDTWLGRAGTTSARWLNRLAQRLLSAGFTPNLLTHAALATGILAGLLFYARQNTLGLAILLLSGLLDAVDGRVARLGPGPTAWGGVLDLTYDRIVEAVVLLGITVPRPELHLPALVLAATWYVNLCVFLAVGAASDRHPEKVIAYPPGLLERADALIFAFIVVLLPSWAALAGYAYAGLEIFTAAQRFRHGRTALRDAGKYDSPLS